MALSSTQSEYMASMEAAKEVVYLRRFLTEFGLPFFNRRTPTKVFCDNQGAEELMKNPIHHARTKHIDIRYHYIRQVYEKGQINVEYLPTTEMIADVLTKPLFGPSYQKFSSGLGVRSVASY